MSPVIRLEKLTSHHWTDCKCLARGTSAQEFRDRWWLRRKPLFADNIEADEWYSGGDRKGAGTGEVGVATALERADPGRPYRC